MATAQSTDVSEKQPAQRCTPNTTHTQAPPGPAAASTAPNGHLETDASAYDGFHMIRRELCCVLGHLGLRLHLLRPRYGNLGLPGRRQLPLMIHPVDDCLRVKRCLH